jgi:hypothetical protein
VLGRVLFQHAQSGAESVQIVRLGASAERSSNNPTRNTTRRGRVSDRELIAVPQFGQKLRVIFAPESARDS